MKKIITVIYTLSFVIGAVSAQSVYDGVKIADKDLNGTARFVGMGGAMGALGSENILFALSKSKCCLELSQTYRSASVACKAIELV